MRRNLEGMVVIITGASTGIGRATALGLARRGTTVVLTARREPELQNVAGQCEKLGGRALVAPADVTDEEAVRAVARKAVENFGRIDAWINNAAVTLFGHMEDAPYDVYRRVIETNLFGYIHGARAVVPYFREQGQGVLVNVASVVGKVSQPYTSAYVVSKFGIVGLTESLRMELRDAPGIRVSVILPGSVDTPLFQHAANYMERGIEPIAPIYSAERVAEAIISTVQRPDGDVVVGSAPRAMIVFHALAPRLFERMYARQVETRHFQDRPATASPGNVFQPMDQYDTVSGGWRTAPQRGRMAQRAAAGAAGLGVGIGLLLAGRALLNGRRLLR